MAIKVLNGKETFVVTCPECKTKLSCGRADLKKGYRSFAAYDTWPVEYITCPACGEDIDIFSDGELASGVKRVHVKE